MSRWTTMAGNPMIMVATIWHILRPQNKSSAAKDVFLLQII